jgi:ribonuclease HII
MGLVAVVRPAGLCGIDEVGRGAASGPLVGAAVVLPRDFRRRLGGDAALIRDSKTLTRRQRERAERLVRGLARALAVEFVGVEEIDARGLTWANRELFRRLLARVAAARYVVDGRLAPEVPPGLDGRVLCRVRADALVPAVSAASIVAKVARDAHMAELARAYPAYGWERNAGYATREHREALRAHGPCPHHRRAFVRTLLAAPAGGRTAAAPAAVPAAVPDAAPAAVPAAAPAAAPAPPRAGRPGPRALP